MIGDKYKKYEKFVIQMITKKIKQPILSCDWNLVLDNCDFSGSATTKSITEMHDIHSKYSKSVSL